MRKIGSGAFSDVFSLGDGRVLKAFRHVAPSVVPHADPSLIPRIAFSAERRAYDQLRSHRDIEAYCPKYFGVMDPQRVVPRSARIYAEGCGLVLEEIRGEPVKLASVPNSLKARVDEVIWAICAAVDIDHPWDGSCFIPGSRADFTLIDFATPAERFHLLNEILKQHGYVPPDEMPALCL